MKRIFYICPVLLLFLAGCQKELTSSSPMAAGDSTLLVRVVRYNEQNDSVVTAYTYNADNRVTGRTYQGKDDTLSYNQTAVITRDREGKVTQVTRNVELRSIIPTSPSLPVNGQVQVKADVHYPAGSAVFDYVIQSFSVSGISGTDSTVYTYEGNRVIRAASYVTASALGISLSAFPAQVTEYGYDGQGNLLSSQLSANLDYSNPAAAPELLLTNRYEYGANPNPQPLGNEGLLYDEETSLSTYIALNHTTVDHTAAEATVSLSFQNVQYTSANLVSQATVVSSEGNNTHRVFYYYR